MVPFHANWALYVIFFEGLEFEFLAMLALPQDSRHLHFDDKGLPLVVVPMGQPPNQPISTLVVEDEGPAIIKASVNYYWSSKIVLIFSRIFVIFIMLENNYHSPSFGSLSSPISVMLLALSTSLAGLLFLTLMSLLSIGNGPEVE